MLPREFNGCIWITEDNRYLRPHQMETEHLKNVLLFLEREEIIQNIKNATLSQCFTAPKPQCEMTLELYEAELFRLMDKLDSISNEEYFHTHIKKSRLYNEILKEYEKRGA